MRKTYVRTKEIREKMRRASLRYYEKMREEKRDIPQSSYRHSEKIKENIRKALLTYNQRLRNAGSKHHQKGRKASETTKRKMSLAKKGMYEGSKNPAWKGGRKISLGYVFILQPYHPFANPDGYIQEHRLIIEKILTRFLKPGEVVHHINGKLADNRPENLMGFKKSGVHSRFHNGHEPSPKDLFFDGRNLV